MANGSSQGFCLGTYFDDDYEGSGKYTKEFDEKAFVECENGEYILRCESIILEAKEVTLKCKKGIISLSELLKKLSDYEKKLNDYGKRIAALESKV